MAARRLSQMGLAKRTRIGQNTVSRILRGTASPSLNTVERIADFIGVSVSQLLSGDMQSELPELVEPSVARRLGRLVEDFLVCEPKDQNRILQLAQELSNIASLK